MECLGGCLAQTSSSFASDAESRLVIDVTFVWIQATNAGESVSITPPIRAVSSRVNMLQVENVSKSFSGHYLFEGVTWKVDPRRRYGLVGPNGVGKSTLVKIIAGFLESDDGRVTSPKGYELGYLPQDSHVQSSLELVEFVKEGAKKIMALADELERTRGELELASGERAASISERYSELEAKFSQRGGYMLDSRVENILHGLGFAPEDSSRSVDEFSGGWRMRALIAKLLLSAPDLLLLDEPTNHLDVESVEWLEQYLREYDGAVVIISHDRYFLNTVTNVIAELSSHGLHEYFGDYDTYLAQRAERLDKIRSSAERQQKEIAEVEDFIERFRYKATKSKQVQSRIKMLEKVERVDTSELAEARTISFAFPQPKRVPKIVADIEDVSKSYGDTHVFSDVRLTLHRGEKIGLVGPNGAGKTTLLKMLAGALEPDSGQVRLGANVRVGYFAQHTVEQLDLSRTVIEEVRAESTDESRTELRSILGAFGFSGSDVDKKISVLSGGERARVALAKMLLQPSECLLLDEPTNHLDIASREMLENAIKDHGGTACIISHDRYFLNATTNLIAHVHEGRVDTYDGNYEYFKYKMKEEEEANASASVEVVDVGPTSSRRELRKQLASLRIERQKATSKQRKAATNAESEVTRLEKEKSRLEAMLADPETYNDPDRLIEANKAYKAVRVELEDAEDVWMFAQEEFDEADSSFAERERTLRGEE